MTDQLYAITPDELQSAAWRGGLYTVGAALCTGIILALFGELLGDVPIMSLCIYTLVGYAAGSAMQRSFTYSGQLPVRVLAVLFTLLGIMVTKLLSTMIFLVFMAATPLLEAVMISASGFGIAQLEWLSWVISFEEPFGAAMMLATPIIGCVVAWKMTTHGAQETRDDHVY